MSKDVYQIDVRWQQNNKKASAQFSIQSGVTALIGPSGAGKTSIARMLSGLSKPDNGRISAGASYLFDSNTDIDLPAGKRAIGYVTQEPALFPTMSVEQNILIASKANQEELKALYLRAEIDDLLERNPATLSGGEARRVAIVRALATKPRLLILDEPMNGLDPKRRKSILGLIRKLAYDTDTPTLLITHQIEEMLSAADHAVLVADGKSLISGSIEHVLSAPETAEHLGIDDAGSIVTATVSGRSDGLLQASVGAQTLYLTDDAEPIGAKLRLRVLSRDVGIATAQVHNISVLNQLEASVTGLSASNHDMLANLALTGSGQSITARITQRSAKALGLEPNTPVFALIKAVAVKELMSD